MSLNRANQNWPDGDAVEIPANETPDMPGLSPHGEVRKYSDGDTVMTAHGKCVVLYGYWSDLQERWYYAVSPIDSDKVYRLMQWACKPVTL